MAGVTRPSPPSCSEDLVSVDAFSSEASSAWERGTIVSGPARLQHCCVQGDELLKILSRLEDERTLTIQLGLIGEVGDIDRKITAVKGKIHQSQKDEWDSIFLSKLCALEEEHEEDHKKLQQQLESDIEQLRWQTAEEEKILLAFHEAELLKLLSEQQKEVSSLCSSDKIDKAYTTYAQALRHQGRDAEAEEILSRLHQEEDDQSLGRNLSPDSARIQLISRHQTEVKAVQCHGKNRETALRKAHADALEHLTHTQEQQLQQLKISFNLKQKRGIFRRSLDGHFSNAAEIGDVQTSLSSWSMRKANIFSSPSTGRDSSVCSSLNLLLHRESVSSLSDGLEERAPHLSKKLRRLEKQLQAANDENIILREKLWCKNATNIQGTDGTDSHNTEISKMLAETRKEFLALKAEKKREAGWYQRNLEQKDAEILRLRSLLRSLKQGEEGVVDGHIETSSPPSEFRRQPNSFPNPFTISDIADRPPSSPMKATPTTLIDHLNNRSSNGNNSYPSHAQKRGQLNGKEFSRLQVDRDKAEGDKESDFSTMQIPVCTVKEDTPHFPQSRQESTNSLSVNAKLHHKEPAISSSKWLIETEETEYSKCEKGQTLHSLLPRRDLSKSLSINPKLHHKEPVISGKWPIQKVEQDSLRCDKEQTLHSFLPRRDSSRALSINTKLHHKEPAIRGKWPIQKIEPESLRCDKSPGRCSKTWPLAAPEVPNTLRFCPLGQDVDLFATPQNPRPAVRIPEGLCNMNDFPRNDSAQQLRFGCQDNSLHKNIPTKHAKKMQFPQPNSEDTDQNGDVPPKHDLMDRVARRLEGPRPNWMRGVQYFDWAQCTLARLGGVPGVSTTLNLTERASDTVLRHLAQTILRKKDARPSTREYLAAVTKRAHDTVEYVDETVDANKDKCLSTLVEIKDSVKKREMLQMATTVICDPKNLNG